MPYPEDNIDENEKIIASGEASFRSLIPSAVLGALLMVCGIYVGFGGFILTLIIAAIIILPKFSEIKNTELKLTDKRVMGKYGILYTKVIDSPVENITNVAVERSAGGKIFGYGKIIISTPSGDYSFGCIKSADSFRNAALSLISSRAEEKAGNLSDMNN